MIDRTAFFDYIRPHLFSGNLNQPQVDGLTCILDAWDTGDDTDIRNLAYILGTTHHETARTMQPIAEYGHGRGKPYGQRMRQDGTIYIDVPGIFYGRGYVQLTWYENYARAGKAIGVDLLHDPDLAMVPENAVQIMFRGMREGWFTGVKLSNYFNDNRTEWVQARRIINGMDRAELVADHGRKYHAALSAGMPDFSDVQAGLN